MHSTQQEKAKDFRALHEGEAFVIHPGTPGRQRHPRRACPTCGRPGWGDGPPGLGRPRERLRSRSRRCRARGLPRRRGRSGGWLDRGLRPPEWDLRLRSRGGASGGDERAGADVLYAPGLGSADEIQAVCAATSKPVNVLAHPGLSVRDIAAAGACRISVGGALAWAAVEAMAAAAEQMRDDGDFSGLAAPNRIREWLGQ